MKASVTQTQKSVMAEERLRCLVAIYTREITNTMLDMERALIDSKTEQDMWEST